MHNVARDSLRKKLKTLFCLYSNSLKNYGFGLNVIADNCTREISEIVPFFSPLLLSFALLHFINQIRNEERFL